MAKGEESTFMILLYSGEIGIYLQTAKELEQTGTEGKCIAKKGPKEVLGEAGLLKSATRGATCIAHTAVEALYMSSNNYSIIVESFHRTELYTYIGFNKQLDFLSKIEPAK